jgi:hypothetical protein
MRSQPCARRPLFEPARPHVADAAEDRLLHLFGDIYGRVKIVRCPSEEQPIVVRWRGRIEQLGANGQHDAGGLQVPNDDTVTVGGHKAAGI